MKRYLQSGVVIFAGVLGIAAGSVNPTHDITKTRRRFDLRSAILRKFLKEHNCPDQEYAEMFIAEADTHGLDWRLLPSISLVESGGGRDAKGNNIFGWSNGKARFRGFGEAIHEVAISLSGARPYAGKDTPGKLAAFNQERTDYSAIVMAIMKQISPRPLIPQQVQAAQ
jgi:hypothetical protein